MISIWHKYWVSNKLEMGNDMGNSLPALWNLIPVEKITITHQDQYSMKNTKTKMMPSVSLMLMGNRTYYPLWLNTNNKDKKKPKQN